MRLSARNQIKGTVKAMKKGATTSHVMVDGAITNESVEELGIKAGGKVTAVIKASSRYDRRGLNGHHK